MAKILVVDDNADILDALDMLLGLHDHQVVTASSKLDAVNAVSRQSIDLVIQDMNFSYSQTSGEEGKALFYELQRIQPGLPTILITAWTQLETAIELVKAGAADYLPKPWDDTKLLQLVAQHCQVKSEGTENEKNGTKPVVVFKNALMVELFARAEKVAKSDINVLITGANGAGKEKLADHIHQHSRRADAPFLKVNMGALPPDLMEAELFGAEKGAFTGANTARVGRFEAADGGTLFLDEIGNLSLAGQMKLLRVLQTGEFEKLGSNETQRVDVRVLSATNVDLALAVKQGSFREDLYYRLNVIELSVPALKQRKDDVLPLAEYFIGSDFQLTDEAKQYLLSYDWPGNVRELENTCKRAMALADGSLIDKADLMGQGQQDVATSEKDRIEQAMRKHDGVIKYAAQELGLSRQALYRRLAKYDLG